MMSLRLAIKPLHGRPFAGALRAIRLLKIAPQTRQNTDYYTI